MLGVKAGISDGDQRNVSPIVAIELLQCESD